MTNLNEPLAPKPTPAELVILGVLWDHGPATVRAVHEAMPGNNASGYTTILKLLQIMHRKGLVVRDDSRRAHVYRPVSSRVSVQNQLTSDLVQRAFDGSASKLVVQALGSAQSASREELDKIRSLLDQLEAQNAES
ncbi:MAG: BlaI/MecI/CopY family transcriptional regulator [Pseudomonadota bacterium]